MTVLHVTVLFHGRNVKIPDGAKLAILPGDSLLVIPPPDGRAGHVVPVEYLPNGDVRGHPSLVAA
jgi:hypothetical protein